MKRTKKAIASLAIAGMTITMIPFNAFAENVVPTRLGGQAAEQTAALIADQTGWTGTAILASSASYGMVDALTASPLATFLNAPILLTGVGNVLNSSTKAQLNKLNVKTIYVTSGTAVITQPVLDELTGMGITVVPLGGSDRFETSVNIAKKMISLGATVSKAAVVFGWLNQDALSIASIASAQTEPILLTEKDTIPASVKAFLTANPSVKTTDVIGGTGVISDAVQTQLPGPTRLHGNTAYDTNVAVLKAFDSFLKYDRVFIANGETAIDALTGAPLAAKYHAGIVLINGTANEGTTYVSSKLSATSIVTALGGTAVVPDLVRSGVVYVAPVAPVTPGGPGEPPAPTTTKNIASATAVTATVSNGTDLPGAKAALGTTVTVNLVGGGTALVQITWTADSTPSYSATVAGTYVFTGTFGTLPDGVANGENVVAPTGTVLVQAVGAKDIASATAVTVTISNGIILANAKAALGTTVTVNLVGGGTAVVPISWSANSTPTYSATVAGDYVFTGTFGTMPVGVTNGGSVVAPSGTVTVKAATTVLSDAIVSANFLKGITPTGTAIGNVSAVAKATFDVAITAATTVLANPTSQAQVDAQVSALAVANTDFLNAKNLVSSKPLVDAIAPAQVKHDGAIEGIALGQYAVGSKATLQTAINAAQAIVNGGTSTDAQVTQAITNLTAAVTAFEAGKITPVVETKDISNVANLTATVANGITMANAKAALGTTVTVNLVGGGTAVVPINWSADSTPAYQATAAGNYVFTGAFGTLPSGVANGGNVTAPIGTVTVQEVAAIKEIASVANVTVTVANGIILANAKASLGTTVTVNLVGGGTAVVPISWSANSTPIYSATVAGDYVFTGAFGTMPVGVTNGGSVVAPSGTVTVKAATTVLSDAIVSANFLKGITPTGTAIGNVSAVAKATFDVAITAATTVLANPTSQAQVDAQVSALAVANTAFLNAKNLVSSKPLVDAIAPAQVKHDGAIEGIALGQYAVGSKATLQTAINAAQAIVNGGTSTDAQVTQAITNLTAAVTAFEAGKIS